MNVRVTRDQGSSASASPAPNNKFAGKRKSGREAQEASGVPALVDDLMRQAIGRRASDIHMEPRTQGMRIRFRIDGLLHDTGFVGADEWPSVVARIKILAKLDITEHRLPQDGRFRIHIDSRAVDVRISAIPTLHGEKVVMRLLDLKATAIPLERVGLSDSQFGALLDILDRPQGMMLVTGPTGSGKTSTIYACLNEIKSEALNILTIEDPVEYEIEGITQISIQEKIGLTFAACLRSVLRQDPDAILVGEVRDTETAHIAMQASLTGHLVMATLHTNDAIGAIARLQDMGIPPYLISASLTAVLAQRLVRCLCPACKKPWEPDCAVRQVLGIEDQPVVLYREQGCPKCSDSGVVGRMGIFELLVITPAIRAAINARADEETLHHEARAAGMTMTTMFEDGVRKVLDGIISYEELLRVARLGNLPAPK